MTKKVLLKSTVVAFIFSGCLSSGDAKPTIDKATKVTEKVEKVTTKVEDKVDKATSVAKGATKKAQEVTDTARSAVETAEAVSAVSSLPNSKLKDEVIESVVEIGDDSTDSTTPQVIESVD